VTTDVARFSEIMIGCVSYNCFIDDLTNLKNMFNANKCCSKINGVLFYFIAAARTWGRHMPCNMGVAYANLH